jgi:hypothetical protein
VQWLEFREFQSKTLLFHLFASARGKRKKGEHTVLRIVTEPLFQAGTIDGGTQQCNNATIHGKLSLQMN